MIYLYIIIAIVIIWAGWKLGKWFYNYLSEFDDWDQWGSV